MRFRSIDRTRPGLLDAPLAQALALPADFVRSDFYQSRALERWLTNKRLKPLLLFVDGGNKARELASFAPLLSTGDYVSVHDYGTEFQPQHVEPVADRLAPTFEAECYALHPCLTRFWRVV